MRYYTDMSRVVTIKSEKRGRLPVKIRLGKKNKQIVQLFPVPVLCLHSCLASKWGLDLRAQVLVARRLPGGHIYDFSREDHNIWKRMEIVDTCSSIHIS